MLVVGTLVPLLRLPTSGDALAGVPYVIPAEAGIQTLFFSWAGPGLRRGGAGAGRASAPPRHGEGDRPPQVDGGGAGTESGAAPPPAYGWSPSPCRGGFSCALPGSGR